MVNASIHHNEGGHSFIMSTSDANLEYKQIRYFLLLILINPYLHFECRYLINTVGHGYFYSLATAK